MATDEDRGRIATISCNILVQPDDDLPRILDWRWIGEPRSTQPVARHCGDDSVWRVRARDETVVSAIALNKSATVQEDQHGSFRTRLGGQVQIQALLFAVTIRQIEFVRQTFTRLRGELVPAQIQVILEIQLEVWCVLHGIVAGAFLSPCAHRRTCNGC
jgi:hypothetical protein